MLARIVCDTQVMNCINFLKPKVTVYFWHRFFTFLKIFLLFKFQLKFFFHFEFFFVVAAKADYAIKGMLLFIFLLCSNWLVLLYVCVCFLLELLFLLQLLVFCMYVWFESEQLNTFEWFRVNVKFQFTKIKECKRLCNPAQQKQKLTYKTYIYMQT